VAEEGKNLFGDLLKNLQQTLRGNLLESLTKGIKGMMPNLFGSQKDSTKSGGDGLAGMFQALMAKIDSLISKLDASFGIKDAQGVNQQFSPSGSMPSIGGKIGSKGAFGGLEGEYDKQLDSLLKGGANLFNFGKKYEGVGDTNVKNDTLTSLLNQFTGGGGKAGGAAAKGAGAAEGALGGIEAAGAAAAPETMGLSLAIPAIIESVKMGFEHISAIAGHIKDVGASGFNAFKSERAEDIGGNLLEGGKSTVKGVARAAGGPFLGGLAETGAEMGMAINPFIQMAEVGFKAIGFLRDFSDHLTKANLQFAQFSGSMAMVQASFEVQKIFLDMARGERRAASAMGLVNAQMGTERMLAPLEDQWANMKADVMSSFHDLFQGLFKDVIPSLMDFMKSTQEVLTHLIPQAARDLIRETRRGRELDEQLEGIRFRQGNERTRREFLNRFGRGEL
jgi:hypothetical protein